MAYSLSVIASNDAYTIREYAPCAPYTGETYYTIEVRSDSPHHSLDNLRSLRAALNEALGRVIPHDVQVRR